MQEDFVEHFRTALGIKTDWPGNAREDKPLAEAPAAKSKTAGALAGKSKASIPLSAELPLIDFQNFLVNAFPSFHKCAERWVKSPYSVVYRWTGTASNDEKTADTGPVLLLGHYDVVPAETAKWSVDPFGAELKDGYIYGRGALDMKSIVMAIMESA